MKRIILENVRLMLLAVIFSLGLGVAYAANSWVGPVSAPTAGNVAAPINASSTDQIKGGGLAVNALAVTTGMAVGGGAYIGGSAIPVEILEVNGNAKAVAFLYSSDINLKKDVKPLGSELEKVLALQPVSFDWKDSGKSDVGLIAQEVEKIFPEVVHTNETTNLKSVDYPKLTVFLISAIKEQQKEIELLKSNR